MSADNQENREEQQDDSSTDTNSRTYQNEQTPQSDYPVPPVGWRPDGGNRNDGFNTQGEAQDAGLQNQDDDSQPVYTGAVGAVVFKLSQEDAKEIDAGRRLVMAAQVCAVVSLFIGGVLLGIVALVLAIMGFRRLDGVARRVPDPAVEAAFRRSGIIAIVVSLFALVLNAITLIAMMPVLTYIAETGDYNALFDGIPAGGGATSNSTWG